MKSNNTTKIALTVVSLLLLGALAYIYTLKRDMNERFSEKKSITTTLEKEQLQLISALDSLEFEVSTLHNLNLKKDSTITRALVEIDGKKRKIKNLIHSGKLSKSEINDLRNQIKQLKNQVVLYKSQVDELREENINLKLAYDTLYIENTNVQQSYEDVKTKYEETSEKIDRTVSVSNFNITPLKVRNSGKEVEKDNSKKVDKLRVKFSLDKNANGLAESKQLYIIIVKPDKSIAKFENATTGTFTTKDGQTLTYSDKINVNYLPQHGSNVEFDWDYNEFVPGTYEIDVYQNGFKIGQATETLR